MVVEIGGNEGGGEVEMCVVTYPAFVYLSLV